MESGNEIKPDVPAGSVDYRQRKNRSGSTYFLELTRGEASDVPAATWSGTEAEAKARWGI